MLFSELVKNAGLSAVLSGGDPEITDVQFRPENCHDGSCFVAMAGPRSDGHRYIPQAVAAGASSVVCSRAGLDGQAPAMAVVPDSRFALGVLAQAVRGWPGRRLICTAVTGSNGKTTVAHALRHVLARAGHKTGLLGTVSYDTGGSSSPASTTTPDPVTLAALAEEMVRAGDTHLVMEVSSHALDQNRTAGIDFVAAVYTNLSGDHLDYHGDMESYFAAKARLFESLSPSATAIINRDDRYAARLAKASAAAVVWYGLSDEADVRATIDRFDAGGARFTLRAAGRSVPVAVPMIGRHNVYNCLAVAAAAMALGVDIETLVAALADLPPVPGRLQRVPNLIGCEVFVDYAHSDDALSNALSAVKAVVPGRVVVVFGCGGDRDPTKRSRMAAVAEQLAERIVITSDNPRSEDGEAIIADITAGLTPAGLAKTVVEPDRGRAIDLAICEAARGDGVLIAGKGHEKYQIIGSTRLVFDDVQAAACSLRRREAEL